MSPPELFEDIALHYLADLQRRQREGAPMKPEHDPQVLVARMHLRPHLCALIAEAGTDPEQIADALLTVGDVHSETRAEAVTVDGKATVALVHRAALTIRNAYPPQYDVAEEAGR